MMSGSSSGSPATARLVAEIGALHTKCNALRKVMGHQAQPPESEAALLKHGVQTLQQLRDTKVSELQLLSLRCCCSPVAEASPILASVASGAVAPLRASWLVALKEHGGVLGSRAALPADAFWTAAELRTLARALGDGEGVGGAVLCRAAQRNSSEMSVSRGCIRSGLLNCTGGAS